MAAFTLRPHCARLEIKGVVYNRTDMPQTFLWWANPAVAVNDAYQSVFPPDVNAVFDHGKRAVSSFPVATGTYYNMDYSAGVDISNYRNIPVPTSYMIAGSRFDFEGGYENDTQAGMLHVANHRVSPGKKQWTWGNGDFGRAWDRNLTDADGPYIELMAGVFTENQPDFTWLMPYEEKSFVQYFMPYRELGMVKQANKDLLINVEPDGNDSAHIKVFATRPMKVHINLERDEGGTLYDGVHELSPETLFDQTVILSGVPFNELILAVETLSEGVAVPLIWKPEPDDIQPIPDPAEAALRPEEIATVEQLYLTGLHLEQYRHATYDPVAYYEEGLRREPLDTRCNNALGLWYLRRGRFDKAEPYLRTAVKVLQKRNPNPYWGEPMYNLALCLRYQALTELGDTRMHVYNPHADKLMAEAYDWFYKSTWNAAWQDAGFFACAQISVRDGRLEDALDELDKSLVRNAHHHKARALKAAVLRLMMEAKKPFYNGSDQQDADLQERKRFISESLTVDPFNFGVRYEKALLEGDTSFSELRALMRHDHNNYEELALDYWNAGLTREADAIWAMKRNECPEPDVCFPNRLEHLILLKDNYLLGCLWYDKRQYDCAQRCWEQCLAEGKETPQVLRCLALVYYNKRHDAARALDCMERAFALDTTDARIFMELDQLMKRMGLPHAERLALFEQHLPLVATRDDLRLEHVTLLNLTGQHLRAKQLLDSHTFHPWEGGEGKVPAQYLLSRIALAAQCLRQQRWAEALPLLDECLTYPPHLGEGKLQGAQDNDIYFLAGLAYEGLGDHAKASECWLKGTAGPTTPAAALYYNDAKPDKIFYAGMCYLMAGEKDKALGIFHKLINFGKQHLFDTVRMDYFAVSLPDLQVWDGDLTVMNRVHCLFMLALGERGLALAATPEPELKENILSSEPCCKENAPAKPKWKAHLDEATTLDINHLGIAKFKLLQVL